MIPRLIDNGWKGIPEQINLDPYNEWYWEDWDQILNNAWCLDKNGIKWYLHQDGDLFTYNENHVF